MAEGDLIVPLEFQEGLPDPPPPFSMGSCGIELYAALAPLAGVDESNDWALARLCEALGRMRQPVSDLVRAWDERGVDARSGDGRCPVEGITMRRSGWSRAAHPSEAPGAAPASASAAARLGHIDLLPFVGQLVGVRGIEQLSTADRREAIRRRDGYSRGQREAILSLAQRFMVDRVNGVTLRERYDPSLSDVVDAPYSGRVVLKGSRIRELARSNRFPNARAEVDLSDVSVTGSNAENQFVSRVPCTWHADRSIGWCFRVESLASGRGRLGLVLGRSGRAGVPVKAGETYTLAAQVNVEDPAVGQGTFRIAWSARWYDAAGVELTGAADPGPSADLAVDHRLHRTVIAPAAAAFGRFYITQEAEGLLGSKLAFEATAVLIEETAVLLPFGDALTPGWRAQGTPHASPAYRPGIAAADIQRRILSRIPAGLLYDVVISDERDWTDVDASWETWADVDAANTDWDDVLTP